MASVRRKILREAFLYCAGLLLFGAAEIFAAADEDTLVYYSTNDFEVNSLTCVRVLW